MADPRPAATATVAAKTAHSQTVEVRTTAGDVVCERCLVADTFRLRLRGLLGRDDLPPGEAVWIRPTNSIHMFFMRFAIDAVFLDRDDVIVKVVTGLEPGRMSSCRGARSVLELAQGEVDRRGLLVGSRLRPVPEDDLDAPA